ncbi:MAG: hypothetical protein LBJ00_14045 [Planctomycetaceae bacterium]|nr:hypothetical protein [Planctomycetaceae bacterium]
MSAYSSCFKIPEAGHASVASRSGCSRAKPIALPATVYSSCFKIPEVAV